MNDTSADNEIVFTQRGGVAHILLNRPKALNALTNEMCQALLPQLQTWQADPAVKTLVITGAGEKAFCSGGDVVSLYKDRIAGGKLALVFWHKEYQMNAQIKHFGKPYIALLDGYVMGGGVGVSIHGSHRVVTDRTTFAMPETFIGLFPDVGGTYFLPRLPGAVGTYLGLSGRRLKAADCIALGLAQHYVPHGRVHELERALEAAVTHADVTRIIEGFAQPAGDAPINAQRAEIDRHFGKDSVEEVFDSLAADRGPWAAELLAQLRKYSPLAMKVTFKQIRMGRDMAFDDCMRLEWRIASRMAPGGDMGHDFYEGVRALLVDKDNAPRWRPATLAEVTDSMVDAYFAPLPGAELDLAVVTKLPA